MKARQKRVEFKNEEGITIAARLDTPTHQKPIAYVLFAHCFTCNKNLTPVKTISRQLTAKGFGVVRFDFTGLGESEGDFADTNFSSNVSDLLAAAKFMEEELEAPKLIIGHSLGGAAAIFAGSKIKSIQAIAAIASPSSPEHVQHLFHGDVDKIESDGVAHLKIGGRDFTIKKQFLEDLKAKNMQEVLKNLRKPILVLHSPQDVTVGIKNASEIYKHAMHPKSFISLDGADHLMTNKRDSAYAGEVIAGWSKRYLDLPEEKFLNSNGQVAVTIGESAYTSEVRAGNHYFRADEPENVGGNDFGPTPYDLLLASLGTCTAMTLRMYANRKKWSLESVEVILNHNKKHEEDCKDEGKIDVLEREITLKGDLDLKQQQRLLEIANKCPVHKTLHAKVKVETKLKK